MKALIKITETNGQRAVNARELHRFLGVQSKFADWIKNRINEYKFIENKDFITLSKNLENGGKMKEYALSIDMAKELSMIEKTNKGRQIRRYFIEMEAKAQSRQAPQLPASQFQRTNKNGISEKRIELINTIRNYLKWGDMNKVAQELGVNSAYIKRIMIDKVHNTDQADKVVKAMYQRALQNKNQLLFNYQEMIDMLKN